MKQVLASVFVGLVISAVIAVQSAESQPEVSFEEANRLTKAFRQWMIGANVKGVVLSKASWNDPSDKNYNLKGRTTRKFLQYEKQVFGINLGWTDNASATTARKRSKWFFARKGGRQGPIRYGETIAIGWGKSPSFIKYDHRNVGINLDWSDKPVYEWTILGGKPGTPVRTGRDWVILYNLAHGSPTDLF